VAVAVATGDADSPALGDAWALALLLAGLGVASSAPHAVSSSVKSSVMISAANGRSFLVRAEA
jgi:hypothetical protein